MNDLFRAIFGFSPAEQGKRTDDRPPDYKNNFRGNGGDDDDEDNNDDNMNVGPGVGIFGFPLFDDSVGLHHRFQRLVSEMNKAFGIFSFNSGPSITWEDESSNVSSIFNDGSVPKEESLRDSYLKKPDCSCDQNNQREEFDINLNLNNDFEQGTSSKLNSEVQFSYPKMYFTSIFIQTVRRPDGTVETIKKVQDHTGSEKTTIIQSNVNDPKPPSEVTDLMPKEDTSGISIFRKFFPF